MMARKKRSRGTAFSISSEHFSSTLSSFSQFISNQFNWTRLSKTSTSRIDEDMNAIMPSVPARDVKVVGVKGCGGRGVRVIEG